MAIPWILWITFDRSRSINGHYKKSAVTFFMFWSLHHLLDKFNVSRVFENMVLRRIFGPRSDEVKGEWRRLHNAELNDLFYSPNVNKIEKNEMGWACGAYG